LSGNLNGFSPVVYKIFKRVGTGIAIALGEITKFLNPNRRLTHLNGTGDRNEK
jgi:hypothetical protein